MARSQTKKSELSVMLDEFEEAVENLKVKYERYFNGVDRVVPVRDRERVDRTVRNLMRQHYRSTMLRFRYAQLKQRYVTYQHYWNRILGQIERGTFKRVVAESQRREREAMFAVREAAQAAAEAASAAEDEAGAGEAGANGPPVAKSAARPPPLGAPRSRPELPDGLEVQQARALFKQFVTAKKAAGEDVGRLTYGALVQKLARELPKLQAKHGKKVSFEVATVDGKVKLRARAGRST